jgi:hypothetical protein
MFLDLLLIIFIFIPCLCISPPLFQAFINEMGIPFAIATVLPSWSRWSIVGLWRRLAIAVVFGVEGMF